MEILKRSQGFTLIEVMITMAVVVLALLGVMSANAKIGQTSEATFERARAIQDANQVIEQMRNTSVTGAFPANVVAAYPNNNDVAGFATLTGQTVRVSYTDVNGDGNSTNDDPLDVTVTVTWLENGTRTVTQTLRTFITQR